MEKPSVAFDPLPNSLPLQAKRVLAAHPRSCHPRRMFGSREKERKGKKMGENEKNGKTGEKRAESLCPKFYWLSVFFYSAWLGDFVANPFTKLQK